MQSEPPFSISEISTRNAAFDEELAAYRDAGVQGIGLWESKLPELRDEELAARVCASGLRATICVPAYLSILPGRLLDGPDDPEERIAGLCASIRRLSLFNPVACICLTGPLGHFEMEEAREIVIHGLRRIGETASEVGVRVGIEPIRSSISEDWSFVTTIPETISLLEDARTPELGIMFDTWHLWDTTNLLPQIQQYAGRFVGVHVSDWREPTRSWCDHVLPGDGVIELGAIFSALVAAGYDGWYDLEIFSDDGTYGNDYPDSLWKLSPAEMARRGRWAFLSAWQARD